jgi:hypothetical protein
MVLCLSLLHLLDDRAGALSLIHNVLKPGGAFISSTFCLADASLKARLVVPLLRAAGIIPRIRPLSGDALCGEIESAGFAIAQRWSPGRNSLLFVVARRRD